MPDYYFTAKVSKATDVTQHDLVIYNREHPSAPFPKPAATPYTAGKNPRARRYNMKFKAGTWIQLTSRGPLTLPFSFRN